MAAPPAQRAVVFRRLIYGGEGDRRLLLAACELALEVADDRDRASLEAYRSALRARRRIKVGTYPIAAIALPPETIELVLDVESAFKNEGERTFKNEGDRTWNAD